MSFDVDIGQVSQRGPRSRNEDFAAALRPQAREAGRGLIAAIADGVSAGGQGQAAAQTAVLSLVGDFHAVPATWETTVALDRLIGAHNAWLVDHNRRRSEDASGLTTLTAVVLRGHTWTVAHVGDTRAWLLRGDGLSQLTHDHSLDHPDLRSRLTRALGLDDAARIDFHQGELQIGDTLLLTSDGVHGPLRRKSLIEALRAAGSAQRAAEALVEAALAAGGQDNATALVIRVRGLDRAGLEDALSQGRRLPAAPRLKLGDTLDGYTVTALVADTGVHRLLQAREQASGELVAIKTLHESRAADPEERAMLAHEAWLGRSVSERDGQGFARVREPRERSAFYVVFDWHGGSTLEQMLAAGRRFTVQEVVQGGLAAARALGRLHRQRVVHRDVKPANLHLGDDGQWRLLDLGAAVSGSEPESLRSLRAGTPSYMNPEQWQEDGTACDPASDIYALGVTLYRWIGGRLPYGEIEPFQTSGFRRDPLAPSRLRPDVPIWLDHVLLKAVARDPGQRFETAEELVLALERGASRPLGAPPPTPLAARDRLALWQLALAVSIAFNLLLVVWLLFLPR